MLLITMGVIALGLLVLGRRVSDVAAKATPWGELAGLSV